MKTGLLLIAAMACGHAPRQAAPGVAAGEVVPVYREPMHREVFHSPLACAAKRRSDADGHL